ncbi:MAG: DedA family protein [Syntrophomonadaceae bacterium]|nr:DedA family protein [Syntrophomonadaceae bacterium]
MEYALQLIEFLVGLDRHIKEIIELYGAWIYLIMFLVLFCETGLVIAPFLPGDSLLFILGAFSASGLINVYIIGVILMVAAVLGNTVNYHIGRYLGPLMFENNKVRFLNKEHLNKTKDFYRRHGAITIVVARFIPIIRTFAPFVAGIGKMHYTTFYVYNIIGSCLWVGSLLFIGFYFGNIPFVQKNLTLIILSVLVLSVFPILFAYFSSKWKR